MANVNNGNTDTSSEEISIKDLMLKIRRWWKYFQSKWLLILCAGALGCVAGITYALVKKPIYKAELDFALQDEKAAGGLSSALGLASQFGIDLGGGGAGGEFSGDNLLALMRSRNMIERSLLTTVNVNGKNETLAELYIDFKGLRKKWNDKPGMEGVRFLPNADRTKFSLKQDSILGIFHKDLVENNLAVDKIDKKLTIISLTVSSTNELFSKYFAEVLAKVVSDYYIQTKTEKSSKNVAMLQRQTDSVRRALNAAISGVASSIDAAPNVNPLLSSLRVPSQHKQVDVTANTIILGELVKNLQISKMSLLQETPLIQVIDKPILPLEKKAPGKISSAIMGAFLFIIIIVMGLLIKELFKFLAGND